jgi:hypothetical protein
VGEATQHFCKLIVERNDSRLCCCRFESPKGEIAQVNSLSFHHASRFRKQNES